MADSTSDGLASLLTGKRVVTQDQVDGVQEGHIVSVDVGNYVAFATMTNSVFGIEKRFGPLRFGRTTTPPEVGDLCLVAFVGKGVSRGWLISWTPA